MRASFVCVMFNLAALLGVCLSEKNVFPTTGLATKHFTVHGWFESGNWTAKIQFSTPQEVNSTVNGKSFLLFPFQSDTSVAGSYFVYLKKFGAQEYPTAPDGVLRFYQQPTLARCEPPNGTIAGGTLVKLFASPLGFYDSDVVVAVYSQDFRQETTGKVTLTDSASGFIEFTLPAFERPMGMKHGVVNVTIQLSLSGEDSFAPSKLFFSYLVNSVKSILYVFVGGIDDLGWTYSLNMGRLSADEQFPGLVHSTYLMNIPEGQYDAPPFQKEYGSIWTSGIDLFRKACSDGHALVVAASYGYISQTKNVTNYPECIASNTQFIVAGAFELAKNVGSFFARAYQMRYLSGIVAGRALAAGTSRGKGCVSYIAAFPLPEILRGLNAFVLGCQEVFPECEVKVGFTSEWVDSRLTRLASFNFWHHDKCDIIAQHTDSREPQLVYSSLDGFGISCNTNMRPLVGDQVLTGPVFNWGAVFSHFYYLVMSGGSVELQYWPGVSNDNDPVSLAPFSPVVSLSTQQLVDTRLAELRSGDRKVFCNSNAPGGEMLMANGKSIPPKQPDGPSMRKPGAFLFDDEGCLLDDPGLLGMYYLFNGTTYPNTTGGSVGKYGAFRLRDDGLGLFPYFVAPGERCASKDYSFNVSKCLTSQNREVNFFWRGTKVCDGGVSLPDMVTVPCDHLTSTSLWGICVYAFIALGVLIALLLLTWTEWHKDHSIVKLSQRMFSNGFTVSAGLSCAFCAVSVGENSNLSCLLRQWGLQLPFTVMFGFLFLKVWRAYRIFDNKKLRRISITNRDLATGVALLASVDLVGLGFWSFAGAPRALEQNATIPHISGDVSYSEIVCKSEFPTIPTFLYVCKALLILGGCFLGWKVRNIDERIAEARGIFMSMNNIAILSCIAVFVTEILSAPEFVDRAVLAISVCLSAVSAMLFVYLPKISAVHWQKESPWSTGGVSGRSSRGDHRNFSSPPSGGVELSGSMRRVVENPLNGSMESKN